MTDDQIQIEKNTFLPIKKYNPCKLKKGSHWKRNGIMTFYEQLTHHNVTIKTSCYRGRKSVRVTRELLCL
ncbi:hypothetical protein SNEBB_006695, partial [Seison nebaliae]